MKIENEIKSKFDSEFHKAVVNIIYTNNFIIDQLNLAFKQFGLTRQQYNVLRILRGQHPQSASINIIRERMLDKMSDASRIVDRLKVKGLILKNISKDDRRHTVVMITDKGLEFLEKLDLIQDELNHKMEILTADEAAELNRILDKIRDIKG